mmetsp:Transcript_43458/g.85754  ORF Transcript_43458/g.85754 Transcript_43458/m.85754 type:complete len:95 (-) Transcript_43458:35-319(-)
MGDGFKGLSPRARGWNDAGWSTPGECREFEGTRAALGGLEVNGGKGALSGVKRSASAPAWVPPPVWKSIDGEGGDEGENRALDPYPTLWYSIRC